MEKNRLFFDLLIFVAACLIIFEAAPRFNGFFGGVITGITLIRMLNFVGSRRNYRQAE